MNMSFINLQAQYEKYKNEITEQIEDVLDSSTYILGPKVRLLENKLSRFSGAKHAIACSSGTDALILALMAIGLKPGDEVITTPFSFIATAEAIAFIGATPVFVDIEEGSYNINTKKLGEKVTEHTKCIMPVSLFGQMANLPLINNIANHYGNKFGHKIYVIEDAAQSFGASHNGVKSCNLSDIACTSFFPAKPLGCYGDGGAIFTSDDKLETLVRVLLNHGQTKQYVHSHIGINGRLDAIQAAVLNVKLEHYPEEVLARNRIAQRYTQALKNVTIPLLSPGNTSVWAQYCIRVANREALQKKCRSVGVPTAVYYPIPLHLQEVFKYLGHRPGDFPIAEEVSKDIIAIPMSAFLSEQEQNEVIEVVNKVSLSDVEHRVQPAIEAN